MNVTTVEDPRSDQKAAFAALRKDLASRSITLDIEYSGQLHDRQIMCVFPTAYIFVNNIKFWNVVFFLFYSRRLSNGYIIKIGRGLNYFLPVDKFCLGYSNYDFRKCKETNVDIFFCPENKKVWKNNHQKPFWHVISVSHWTKLKKKTILYSSTLFILFWIKTIQNPMPWAALKIRH